MSAYACACLCVLNIGGAVNRPSVRRPYHHAANANAFRPWSVDRCSTIEPHQLENRSQSQSRKQREPLDTDTAIHIVRSFAAQTSRTGELAFCRCCCGSESNESCAHINRAAKIAKYTHTQPLDVGVCLCVCVAHRRLYDRPPLDANRNTHENQKKTQLEPQTLFDASFGSRVCVCNARSTTGSNGRHARTFRDCVR